MDFDDKLTRALGSLAHTRPGNQPGFPERPNLLFIMPVTESVNWGRGILYLPYVTRGRVHLQSAVIKHLVFSRRGRYFLHDFGRKGQRPEGAKFEGFAVMTTGEEAPAIVSLASAELGDRLIGQASECDSPGYEGLFVLPPEVAGDEELIWEVRRLSDANSLRHDEGLMADLGFYFERGNPDREPVDWAGLESGESGQGGSEWDPDEMYYRDG